MHGPIDRHAASDLVGQAAFAGRELGAATVMFHQAVAERVGLSVTEHKATDILLRTGPATAGELAERTGLSTGAITGLVDRLEEVGLVRRERDAQDRRRVILHPVLDRKMARAYERVFSGIEATMRRELSRYSANELKLMTQFYRHMSEVLHAETLRLREMPRTGAHKRKRASRK